MKKLLAILLTLILTFSCFSILGTTALAEETETVGQYTDQVILESSFTTENGKIWQGANGQKDDFLATEGGDPDFFRITVNKAGKKVYLVSAPFELIPGNDYELSFDVRIPNDSESYLVDGTTFKAPEVIFYEPTLTSNGNTSSLPGESTTEASNTFYAYKYSGEKDDAGNYTKEPWGRRADFSATWTIEGYGSCDKKGYSSFSANEQYKILGGTPDLKETYASWTTITSTFTALADEEGETSQTTAFAFRLNKLPVGCIIDISNVKITCTKGNIEGPARRKTILKSDFDISDGIKWAQTVTSVDPVAYMVDEKDGANFVRISSLNKDGAGIKSTPFNLIPEKDYELSFYIRVPENTKSYLIGDTFYAPSVVFYEAQANEDGRTSNSPITSSKAEQNNYYAYKNIRRTTFVSNWTIGDYGTSKRERYSSFSSSNHASVLKEQFTDINAAYKDWTKITARFTALADEEGETEQLTALAFYFSDAVSDLVFDIKDVKLVENPDALPEDSEDDEEPETPEEIIPELPYLSIVDANGNQSKYGADIGAKAEVKDNADGTLSCSVEFDDMDTTNLFMGWYDGDTFLSSDKSYTAPATVNKETLKAKILCRSVISGGLGFESYTEKTALRVSEEDANQNLHNIAPFEDKWGQMYKSYQQATEWLMPIQVVNGTQRVKYTTDYVDGAYTTDYVNVTPYSGSSMFNFAARGRAIVRKLDNLKPNTNYEVTFYVYNSSKWDFLNKAIITDSYELSVGNLAPSSSSGMKVYSAYVADSELDDKNGKAALKNEDLIHNWSKISVSFKTDSNDTFLYLHLAQANGYDNGSTSNIFLDNLTCTETVVGYKGNAIRANDGETPQALRYKFAIDNDMLNGFAGMTTAKIGILAAKSEACGDDELEIGKSFAKDVEVTADNFQTVSGDSANKYITVALYNIGKKGNNVDYSAYGSDYSVRPYIIYKDENGVENVVYGNTVDANVFNVMLAILSENNSESDIEIAKGLLEKEEISKEYYKWQPTDGWYLGESQASDYAYSFAVIGDIQKTTQNHPTDLHHIYDWIIDNADDKNIQYVMGMGDLTDNNKTAQWELATEQHYRLEEAGLNQSIVRGNHDDIDSFDEYITSEKFGSDLTYTFNGMRNTCRLTTIGGVKYMMLTLDFYPTNEEIDWAADLIEKHSDYNVILSTHAYIKNVTTKGKMEYETSLRQDFATKKLAEYDDGRTVTDLNSGQEIYEKLVSKYSNIVLVLCGHNDPYDDGPNHRIVTREDGSQVIEMMTNFQDMESRNNRAYGMVVMLYVKADGTVQLETFSSINGMFFKDNFQFEFKLDLVD